VDFNPWGGATLPLLFDWHELSRAPGPVAAPKEADAEGDMSGVEGEVRGAGGGGGYTDDLEFRVVTCQGHIRPGLQLGIPFDMYNRAPNGALASFVEQQRRRQTEAAAAASAAAGGGSGSKTGVRATNGVEDKAAAEGAGRKEKGVPRGR